ncbi:MAG: YceI family protein [Bacteroidales bacterium]|nr:YceI family protein [Bacteroidales bacterium]
MKHWLIGISVFLLVAPQILAQKNQVDIGLLSESWLTIRGQSNINTFQCQYSFGNDANTTYFIGDYNSGKLIINDVQLNIPVREFKCGNKLLNKDLQKTLEAKKQPAIGIHIEKLKIDPDSLLNAGNKVWAKLTIAGVERLKQIDYSIDFIDKRIFLMKGSIQIDMESFKIDTLKRFLGAIKIEEQVGVSFLFKFEHKYE